MAIDPFTPDDQKRRLQDLARNHLAAQRAGGPFSTGVATATALASRPEQTRATKAATALALNPYSTSVAQAAAAQGTPLQQDPIARAGQRVASGQAAPPRSPRERGAGPRSAAETQRLFELGQARNTAYQNWQEAAAANVAAQEAQLTRDGVHRIRRGRGANGETVYEDVSPRNSLIVGDSEEMMFGANSQRIGRGLQRPGAPAQGFDAYGTAVEQQNATNQYYAALNEENAPQMQALGRRLSERQQAPGGLPGAPGGTDPGYQYYTDERGNRTLLTQQQAAARGLARPGTANADARTAIALAQFQAQQQQNQITNERADRADERAERQATRQDQILRNQELAAAERQFAENPQQAIQNGLARISSMRDNPAELDTFFREDPYGQLLERNINQQLRGAYRGGVFSNSPRNLGDLQPRNGLARSGQLNPFRDIYGTPDDQGFGGFLASYGVDLNDVGLSSDDRWLLNYFADRNRRDAERQR